MTHAHYDFIAGRRLSLISPEYSAPTQRNSLPSPTSQWQLLHGRSSYLADGALAQQQPTFQAYLNSFASHDSGWHAGQSHHVEPDSYRAADISISAPSGRARVFPVSPPNDYTEPVHPTLSHSQSNHPNILPAYKNEPSAFQCDITPSTSPASNPSVSNPSFDSSKWSDSLYTLDRSESPPHTPPSPSPPTPPQPVKVEQEDPAGCFIMELSPPQSHSSLLSQSMAPPMEVPLRATQAPEGMRGMMNAFRLNPFAIQNADGRNAPQPCIMEAGPLEEEPVMLEFQIELSEPLVPPEAQTEAPSSTSPEQSLDQSLSRTPENDDDNRGQWGTYQAGEPPFTSAQDSWDESNVYVQTSEGRFTPPQDDGPAEFTSPPITRTYSPTVSNSYVQGEYEQSNYTVITAPPSTLDMHHQIRSSQIATNWRNGGQMPSSTSRSSPFMSASPGCDSATTLPSMMPPTKRWSYHDAALAAPFIV